jgi:small subunit ribosomal protein S5
MNQDNKRKGKGKHQRAKQRKDEFDQKIIDIARVTRVMAGGKRMRFRACVVVGDKKGRVGVAVRKGADVTMAVNKAALAARKNLSNVRMIKGTIPHQVRAKYGSAVVLLKPAPEGAGIIAGGAVRAVLELAGLKDVASKMQGSPNKINNVSATIEALKSLKNWEDIKKLRS